AGPDGRRVVLRRPAPRGEEVGKASPSHAVAVGPGISRAACSAPDRFRLQLPTLFRLPDPVSSSPGGGGSRRGTGRGRRGEGRSLGGRRRGGDTDGWRFGVKDRAP